MVSVEQSKCSGGGEEDASDGAPDTSHHRGVERGLDRDQDPWIQEPGGLASLVQEQRRGHVLLVLDHLQVGMRPPSPARSPAMCFRFLYSKPALSLMDKPTYFNNLQLKRSVLLST